MWYILHGEEEFGRSEELGRLRAETAGDDPAMAELNTSLLDGSRLTLGELRHASDAIPFLSQQRLVIVSGLLGRLAPAGKGEGQAVPSEEPASRRALLDDLAAYLPNLPPTTWLVFVEDRTLAAAHPILKLAETEARQKRAVIKSFRQPKDWEVPKWIEQRARSKGGNLNREAVDLLAAMVGNDLRLLDQEIDKLLLYAGGRRVTVEDVQTLVSYARQASIFDLVDCVGRRQADRALLLLHRLLDEGEPPLYLLTMLARQVRILIQVSELSAQRLAQGEIAARLKLHPYVVEKTAAQAHNFSPAQLEAAHQRLVETDWSIKSGDMDEVLALDMLVVALTRM